MRTESNAIAQCSGGLGCIPRFPPDAAPRFKHHHGNWKHGYRSKQYIAGMRRLRVVIAILDGRWAGPLPRYLEPAPGWSAYRAARRR
jgi:hypothetical protein